ncbi:hypothetical protein N7G274_007125 [Stereocaulon virgatum]|uniref:DUF3835 domain-containing protein n=1 Tax=Stereocaulon virgatum TaxID=373712 RepID=A0ABR4A2Q2_9LECA
MTGVRDTFVDLERHRLQLEQNVAKLQASLRHWQQWELEYEGMKEELVDLETNSSQPDLGRLGEDSDSDFLGNSDSVLLTPKERSLLLLDDKGQSRDTRQVLGLLSRRIDYVQKNEKTISSLLQAAEEKYAASLVLVQPEVRDEEGLPLIEIHEELDEEGNVISGTTSTPGDTAPQLVEALSKAGIKVSPATPVPLEIHDSQPKEASRDHTSNSLYKDRIQMSKSIDLGTDMNKASFDTQDKDADERQQRPPAPRKSVSFADGTKTTSDHKKVGYTGNPLPTSNPKIKLSREDKARLQDDAIRAILGTDSLSQEEKNKAISAVIKKGASQPLPAHIDEEWKLTKDKPIVTSGSARRIGKDLERNSGSVTTDEKADTATEKSFEPVIPVDESPEDAALRRQMIQYNMGEVGAVVAELELDEEGISYSDDDDEDYLDENSSIEEDEDKFGRTKQRVLSDDYLAEMKALEKRLQNIGPNAGIAGVALADGHRMLQQPSDDSVSKVVDQKPKSGNKKGVRFAKELEIQEAPKPTPNVTSQQNSEPKPPPRAASNPVHASVIERPFRASTSDNSEGVPAEPDDYDPALVQQEVATEYHKMRNRMIQRQGGFTARDEEKAEVPLTEAEGGPKKMSRFKAARLGRV